LSHEGVEAAAARPFNGYYTRIEDRAAALAHGIAKGHAFVDGNKRTALTMMTMFLERSGYRFRDPAQVDATAFLVMEALADSRMSRTQLARWIAERIEHFPLPRP